MHLASQRSSSSAAAAASSAAPASQRRRQKVSKRFYAVKVIVRRPGPAASRGERADLGRKDADKLLVEKGAAAQISECEINRCAAF